VPADGPCPGNLGQHFHRASDRRALRRLVHVGVFLPTPAVTGNLVAAFHCILDKPGRELGCLAAGADGRGDTQPLERVGDPPPGRLGAVLEVGFHAAIGNAHDFVGDLVDLLVQRIARGQRHLRAFLEIDDERHGDPRAAGPLRIRRRAPVARKVTSHVTNPGGRSHWQARRKDLWNPSPPAGDRCRRWPCAASCAPALRPSRRRPGCRRPAARGRDP
jgi:hypothetical protein